MLASFGSWGGWAALTAIGTVGAVVVAVGLQWWLDRRAKELRPDLSLAFDDHFLSEEQNLAGATVPYLRLAVKNAAGKHTAEDVEVLIERITEYAVSPIGSGGRVVWLANPALGWANSVDPRPRMSIPPGATRYVDVACWPPMPPPLEAWLCVVPTPGSGRHQLPLGGWCIRLAVTLRNADASFWEAHVSFEEQVSAGIASPIAVKATVAAAN